MKRILFIIRDFKQGGIPRCLQSLLPMVDRDKYAIDLLCLYQEGPYKNAMPNCNVLPQDKVFVHLLAFGKNLTPIKHPVTFAYKITDKVLKHLFGFNFLDHHIEKVGKSLSGKYDVVIAYSEGIAAQIAARIQAPSKIVWIHNDYSFECARGDAGTTFEPFYRIVCVSEATRTSFIAKFPEYAFKTITIYNIINDEFICKSAMGGAELSENYFNIVSIGRICYQKNFDVIPSIFTKLPKDVQKKSKWYIIGNGPEDEVKRLKTVIQESQLDDKCILLGAKDNPYPYIKRANLFVLTSRYESYPTVINEALVLDTPVISVDIPPVYEMLDKDRIYSLEKLPDAISVEIASPSDCHWLGATAHNHEVMEKFYNLLENR